MVLASNISFYPYDIYCFSHTPNSLLINNRRSLNRKLLEDNEFATKDTTIVEMENFLCESVIRSNRNKETRGPAFY